MILSGLEIEQEIADFRLLSRQVCDRLGAFHEQDLFVRGMIKWIGYRQYAIDFIPDNRFSGRTKYTGKNMTGLALQ